MKNLLVCLLVCYIALAFLPGCSERHNDRNWTMEHSRKVMEKDKADKAAFGKLSNADVKRMKAIDKQIASEKRMMARNSAKIKKLNDLPYSYEGEEMRKIKQDRYTKHLDAAICDNSRRQKRIDKLESKKAEILRQESASCFPGETFIQTKEGRLKPIMQIKAGEMIMAFDIGSQTNVPRRVLKAYKDTNNHYYLINKAIKATAYERFLTTNGWEKVMNLKKGDIIKTNQGLETIDSLIIENGILEVYNLQVEESHTFYVAGQGDKLYLVHNTSGGGSSGK
ncbi:MAG: hypothetical protein KAJ62_00920 [Desulfobacteraceae bacterium]|nr:hypothetical protein [Desulfobacteraceae bacterium]